MAEEAENELLDYEEASDNEAPADASSAVEQTKKEVKGTYVSIHSSGFRDFLLKPELLRAIVDCGFEHPSEGESLSWMQAGNQANALFQLLRFYMETELNQSVFYFEFLVIRLKNRAIWY